MATTENIIRYGLTETGFKRKRLAEVVEDLNNRISDKLGIPIQTAENSVFGQLIQIFGYEIADLWEECENTYNAMYPNTANGISLSNAAALAGISQITAEKTRIYATCTGKDGTLIPQGTQIGSTKLASMKFECENTYQYISKDQADSISVTITGNVTEGTVYKISLDGKAYSYKGLGSETVETALAALGALITDSAAVVTASGTTLTVKQKTATNYWAVKVENLTIKSVSSPIKFICTEEGAINPSLGEVTSIIDNVDGFTSVTNETAAIVGRDDESDTSLRQRWSLSVYDKAVAMIEAIRAALLQVTGVTAALVYENTSDDEDEDGRPPHSIECVVQGGADDEIAACIWQRKGAGIDTFGTTQVQIFDSQSVQHIMKFNRPIETKVWLKLIISENPEEEFPEAGLDEIATAVLEKGNAHEIGEDVVLQKFYATIYDTTTGIGYITLTACTGDEAGDYTAKNIEIDARHTAVFDKSRLYIELWRTDDDTPTIWEG